MAIHKLDKGKYVHLDSYVHSKPLTPGGVLLRIIGMVFLIYVGAAVVAALGGSDITEPNKTQTTHHQQGHNTYHN